MASRVAHVPRRPGDSPGFPSASFLGPDLSEPGCHSRPDAKAKAPRATHQASWPPPSQPSHPPPAFRSSQALRVSVASLTWSEHKEEAAKGAGPPVAREPFEVSPGLLAPCPARLRPALCRGGSQGSSCLQGRGKSALSGSSHRGEGLLLASSVWVPGMLRGTHNAQRAPQDPNSPMQMSFARRSDTPPPPRASPPGRMVLAATRQPPGQVPSGR